MYLKMLLNAAMSAYPFDNLGDETNTAHYKNTQNAPGLNTIYGILECALGLEDYDDTYKDQIEALKNDITIKIVRPRHIEHRVYDLQTVHHLENDLTPYFATCNGGTPQGKETYRPPLQTKVYLSQAEREVHIYGSKERLEEIKEALLHPVYSYYIGRACCIPSKPVFQGIVEDDKNDHDYL